MKHDRLTGGTVSSLACFGGEVSKTCQMSDVKERERRREPAIVAIAAIAGATEIGLRADQKRTAELPIERDPLPSRTQAPEARPGFFGQPGPWRPFRQAFDHPACVVGPNQFQHLDGPQAAQR